MAGPSEGGGMLEVVGAQRRDVLTAGDVAETERDALGNVSEGAGPLDEAGGPAATAKGRPSRPDAPEGGLGDKLSQPAGDRRAAAAMRSRVDAAKLAIAREAVSQLDDSEELEGASGMYDAGRAAKKAAGRLRQRKAKKAAQGSRKAATALGAPKGGAPGPEAAGATAPAKHQAAQAAAQASGEAARAAGSKGAASAIAGAVSGAAPALLGAVAGIVAFVACALAVAQLLSALFGFWDDAASKQGLEGLPPYITYEMVEAALECQEEYGHPAGCTIAQIIQESGQGDRMSQLAERDHNLFGMKWWSGYAGCPEVAGKANWATSEEYVPGEHTQITASFIRFTGDAECIRFRSRVFLQAERYSGNALIREAIEGHDSDRMAEGLKDAGWATDSSYVESLKSIMAQWGLYRLDSMTVEDLKDASANGNAIVEAAYSQLGVPYVWGGSTPRQGARLQRAHAVLLRAGGHPHKPLHGFPVRGAQAHTALGGEARRHPLPLGPRGHLHRRRQVHTRAANGRRVPHSERHRQLQLRAHREIGETNAGKVKGHGRRRGRRAHRGARRGRGALRHRPAGRRAG